jgi:hypothetical protein
VMARLPQSARMAELSPAEQFAAVELFRGTMVRHSVIVHRNDSPSPFEPIGFAGDAWMSYVPIRMSETICVEDRLPAAVLLNQNHTHTDLLMPIDAKEKLMFDAIDAHRSIRDILETTPPAPTGQRQPDARSFFERLWWHDQIVFDASRS